jgi:hypothetical protein
LQSKATQSFAHCPCFLAARTAQYVWTISFPEAAVNSKPYQQAMMYSCLAFGTFPKKLIVFQQTI